MRVGLHVGRGVDDHQVAPADHEGQLHEVQVPGTVRAAGPGPLVVQRPDHREVVATPEHLHGDGPAVDRVLVGAGCRAELGQGGRGLRHRPIVASRPVGGANATSLKPCRTGPSRLHPMRVTEAVRRWRRQ